MHHVTKQNVVSDWFHDEHDDEISSSVPFPVTGSESTRSTLGRSRTEHSQHESAPETFAGHAILSTWTRCVLLPMPFTSPLFCAELHSCSIHRAVALCFSLVFSDLGLSSAADLVWNVCSRSSYGWNGEKRLRWVEVVFWDQSEPGSYQKHESCTISKQKSATGFLKFTHNPSFSLLLHSTQFFPLNSKFNLIAIKYKLLILSQIHHSEINVTWILSAIFTWVLSQLLIFYIQSTVSTFLPEVKITTIKLCPVMFFFCPSGLNVYY